MHMIASLSEHILTSMLGYPLSLPFSLHPQCQGPLSSPVTKAAPSLPNLVHPVQHAGHAVMINQSCNIKCDS